MEEWNILAKQLLNEEISSLELSKLDMYSTDTTDLETKENNLDSDDTELYEIPENIATNNIDSDSTEPYEIQKKIIGTIFYSTTATQLPFKCPVITCKKEKKHERKSVIIIDNHIRKSASANFVIGIILHPTVLCNIYTNIKI